MTIRTDIKVGDTIDFRDYTGREISATVVAVEPDDDRNPMLLDSVEVDQWIVEYDGRQHVIRNRDLV